MEALKRMNRRRWALGLAIASVLVLSAGLALGPVGEVLAEQARAALFTDATSRAPGVTVDLPTMAELVEQLEPSVVSITVIQTSPIPPGHPLHDFFRYFGGMPEAYRGRGLGTGFIINQQGHVLTNSHVVEDAQQIQVQLHDGTEVSARVVAIDPPSDIALLQIPRTGHLPAAVLGDSDSLRIGDWVVAIGNPFGLDSTVTAGIVSALERRQINPEGRGGYHNYIQTDASINPGNSGGPLFNLRGEVVGINGAINAAGQGIGFAIPINMAKTLLPMMARDGVVRRSWMGVATQPVTRTLARSFGLTGDPRGALVSEAVPGGPAARAGIREGDIVLRFDGRALRRADELPWLSSSAGVGRTVAVEIWRGGRSQTVNVTLGTLPGTPARPPAVSSGTVTTPGLGITVGPAHPSLISGVQGVSSAVMVTSLDPDGQGARAGLQRGDVILAVGDQAVDSVASFQRQSAALRAGQVVRLRIVRERNPLFVAFEYGG
jgi:serine protease Do